MQPRPDLRGIRHAPAGRARPSVFAQQHAAQNAVRRKPATQSTKPKRVLNKRVAFDVLDKAHQDAAPNETQHQTLRFPAAEFRSLCINPLVKVDFLGPFPDKGTWNKHKLQLTQLLLLCSSSDPQFQEQLEQLVEASLERELRHLRKAARNDTLPREEFLKIEQKYKTRRTKLLQQLDLWCRTTVKTPNFQLMKPVLKKVLEIEPNPQVDQKRDGQLTEVAISTLVARELPPGWTMYTQCRMMAVDGSPFKNEKMVKGEADVVLTDAHGIVQAILEIKTAKGNPYLALWEDVRRFKNMTDRVRGRLVTFTPSNGHPLPAMAPEHGVAEGHTRTGVSSSSPLLSGEFDPVVTLRFSKNVKPIYVLGSCIAPEDLAAVVKSAQSKLLTMELGRILSTQMEAWKDVSILEINPDTAILQVPQDSFPQCQDNVHKYFQELQACEIFMLPNQPAASTE